MEKKLLQIYTLVSMLFDEEGRISYDITVNYKRIYKVELKESGTTIKPIRKTEVFIKEIPNYEDLLVIMKDNGDMVPFDQLNFLKEMIDYTYNKYDHINNKYIPSYVDDECCEEEKVNHD